MTNFLLIIINSYSLCEQCEDEIGLILYDCAQIVLSQINFQNNVIGGVPILYFLNNVNPINYITITSINFDNNDQIRSNLKKTLFLLLEFSNYAINVSEFQIVNNTACKKFYFIVIYCLF